MARVAALFSLVIAAVVAQDCSELLVGFQPIAENFAPPFKMSTTVALKTIAL